MVKASIWLIVSELVFNLSGYVTHSALGRFLGPADYGRYSIIITFSTMVIVLIGRGVPIAMSKYLSESNNSNPAKIMAVRSISAKVQIILIGVASVIYFLLAPVFAALLQDPTLTPLFRISSLIIPAFAAATFYVYYFTGIQQFEKQAFLKFFRSLTKVIVIVVLALALGTAGAVLGHAIAPLVVFIVAYFADPYRKKQTTAEKLTDVFSWKKLLNFAWPITLFMIFYEVMVTVDLYLVKAQLGDDALTGIYNAAVTVARIPFYAFYFLTIILLPKISETTSRGLQEQTQSIMQNAMRFLFMMLVPSVALLSAFAPSAIRFFYGARYSDGAAALSILVFAAGCLTVFYVLAFVLNGAGKNKIPMWTAFLGCIANVLLVSRMIPAYGIQGAAIGTAVTAFCAMVVLVVYSHKNIAKFFVHRTVGRYVFAGLVVNLIAANLLNQGRFIFIIWSLLLFGLYLLILFIFKEFGKDDLDYFISAIKRKKISIRSDKSLT